MSIIMNSDLVPINKDIPLVNAKYIAYKDGRLPDFLPVPMTQAEYDAAKEAGELNENTPYLIVEEDDNT